MTSDAHEPGPGTAPFARAIRRQSIARAVFILALTALGSWFILSLTASRSDGPDEDAAITHSAHSGDAKLPLGFPEGRELMALIAIDRDIADYRALSSITGPTGAYYKRQVELCLAMRPLRAKYERLFAEAHAELSGEGSGAKYAASLLRDGKPDPYLDKAPSPFTKSEYWFTPKEQLKHAHPYALDVFFKSFKREDGRHIGPKIRALYPGIVVAAAGDWEGGAGASTYRGGGLSPAAGNGVVVFDRLSRRYYSYLHLDEVFVKTGEIVKAGHVLGRGGNTGMNARKPDHGGHVHVEIFDCERDTALRGTEILDIIRH